MRKSTLSGQTLILISLGLFGILLVWVVVLGLLTLPKTTASVTVITTTAELPAIQPTIMTATRRPPTRTPLPPASPTPFPPSATPGRLGGGGVPSPVVAPSQTILPLHSPTPLANPSPWSACTATILSRLRVGGVAYVSFDPPFANTVRAASSREADRLGEVRPGGIVEVQEGPQCANGWIWWKVRERASGLTGWTAEGDKATYWLVPCKPGAVCY